MEHLEIFPFQHLETQSDPLFSMHSNLERAVRDDSFTRDNHNP